MALILILCALAACFVLFRRWLMPPRRRPAAARDAALATLHASAAAAIVVALALWFLLRPWALAVTLDVRPMIAAGLWFGLLLVVAWTVVGVRRLEGVPLRQWAPWLMASPLVAPILGVALAGSANIAFDFRAGEPVAARVTDAQRFASGRGSRTMNYRLSLAGDGLPSTPLHVSWRVHRRLRARDELRVVRHEGAFGWAWLDGFEARRAE